MNQCVEDFFVKKTRKKKRRDNEGFMELGIKFCVHACEPHTHTHTAHAEACKEKF